MHTYTRALSHAYFFQSDKASCGKETSEDASHTESAEIMNQLQRVQLANEGMRLLLCSQLKEAEELFKTSRNLGPELNAGYSFVQLVRAVMSFDDDAMDSAYKSLEVTESFCEVGSKKISIFSRAASREQQQMLSPHDKLHCKAIVADCILFEAILVFLKQGLTSYVKGGYLVHKAYKMYEKIFEETEELCKLPSPISKSDMPSPVDRHVGTSVYDTDTSRPTSKTPQSDVEVVGGDFSSMHVGFAGLAIDSIKEEQTGSLSVKGGAINGDEVNSEAASEDFSKGEDTDFPWSSLRSNKKGSKSSKSKLQESSSGYEVPSLTGTPIDNLEHEDARLRGAIYFGYGIMNVVMSLIPPKLMKLANLLGFHCDRRVGLEALEYASNSQDMKAPLARPFFALDGETEGAGTDEAIRLLDLAQDKYTNSALFLYFRGKVCYLRCQLADALKVYTEAAQLAREQREIEHVILYEQGWIYFLEMDYEKALTCYIKLKTETRWSACYYAYLSAIISGVMGNLKQAREFFLQSTKLVKKKNNNLEKFCSRRGSHYRQGETAVMNLEMLLFAVEVIYLWRAFPFCSVSAKRKLLEKMSAPIPEAAQVVHRAMRAWLKGALLSSLNEPIEAEKSLNEALRYDNDIRNEKHILSFSLYELAMLQIRRNEFARARQTLTLAKEGYSGYEFEARLNFKVHSAMNLCQ